MRRSLLHWLAGVAAVAIGLIAVVAWDRASEIEPAMAPCAEESARFDTHTVLAPVTDDASRLQAGSVTSTVDPIPLDTATRGAHVTVVVRAAGTSTPLSGVTVIAWSGEREPVGASATRARAGGPMERLRTQDDGRVELSLPAGESFRVWAFSENRTTGDARTRLEPLEVGHVREITLEIPFGSDAGVWMQFVDADTRAPLREGCVHDNQRGTRFPLDDGGRAFVRFSSFREPLMTYDIPGYGADEIEIRTRLAPAGATFVFALHAVAELNVMVVNGRRAPVPDALVTLRGLKVTAEGAPPSSETTEHVQRTDADGRARFVSIAARRPLDVTVTGSFSQTTRHVELEPRSSTTLEICAIGTARIRGRVLDDSGQAIQGILLTLSTEPTGSTRIGTFGLAPDGMESVSNPDGTFVFDNVPAGTWFLGPTSNAPEAWVPEVCPVVVPFSVEIVDVTLKLRRCASLTGVVVDARGNPVDDVLVTLVGEGVRKSTSTGLAIVGTDGRFRFDGLPHGSYVLAATSAVNGVCSRRVSTTDGEITLRLGPGAIGGGRVVDEQGQGVQARLVARPSDTNVALELWTVSQPDGAFLFQLPDSAPWLLTASTEDGRLGRARLTPSPVTVPAEQFDVLAMSVWDSAVAAGPTIPVTRACRVRVQLVSKVPLRSCELWKDGEPLERFLDLTNGHLELTAPTGPATLRVRTLGPAGKEIERSLEFRAGSTQTVLVRLEE